MGLVVLALCALGAIAIAPLSKERGSAEAAGTSFTVLADSGGTCFCCPELNASISVNPETGEWTVQLTQGNPAVPVSVTVVSYTEQTSTTSTTLPNGTPRTVPGNSSSPPTTPPPGQPTGAGGAVTGVSSAVATGDGNDTNDDAPGTSGVDLDSQTFHTLRVKRSCPQGQNCGSGDCMYTIKWTSTSNEGFSVSRTT